MSYDTINLSRLEEALAELSYPVSREDAANTLDGTTLLLADGEADLGELVAATQGDRYTSREELQYSLHNTLPTEAVGERYQSEGEG
ncbi:hypothetical protein OB919_06610 [Halobacteria archaeon AArc-curdl1]|uniref:DUF2795 domain-containing protein n=1 Tax=Natronosalvus hydrolyticus TaxID=2979988 RepID=A0AAP2Z6L4_9EURY|nr:hypothetical protein [Halobacteria archaeon AArc-curdl1]